MGKQQPIINTNNNEHFCQMPCENIVENKEIHENKSLYIVINLVWLQQ